MLLSMQATNIDLEDEVNLRRLLQKSTEKIDQQENTSSTQAESITALDNGLAASNVRITTIEDANYTANPQQTAIAPLAITVTNPPTQAEVQAVADKVDALILALQNSNILS